MNEAPLSDLQEFSNKGLTGLGNCGNSCYLNACVQILSHTYELSKFLDTQTYTKRINKVPDSVLLVEWDNLRRLMWSDNCTIAPWGFVKSVQRVAQIKNRDIFTGNAQNDVQEFLLFLIDGFHMALSRTVDMEVMGSAHNDTDKLAKECYSMIKTMYQKEYSEMLGIFYGIHVSVITSKDGNEQLSIKPEPFSIISLPIPNSTVSLYDCFNEYCKKEILNNENAWFNDKTNEKEDALRGITFWSLPNILIIDLKRWNDNGNKNQSLVDIPLNDLDLSPYVDGYNKDSYIYDLYGICNHSGNVLGGHYTSYVKNANDKWYMFNDTQVSEISADKVVSPLSYCLFYRKKK